MDIPPLKVYNSWFFPWRVPSMNDLVLLKASGGKVSWLLRTGQKKRNPYQFNMYNQLKQEWSKMVCDHIVKTGFNTCKASYFHYLLVEPNMKRDPSNIAAAAAKFIEDGLIKAGVIENDGWKQVLGIRPYWIHKKDSDGGVFLLMSSEPLSQNAIESYYNSHATTSQSTNNSSPV